MRQEKIKFLLLNEASYANTGFGIYGRNLLSGLKKDERFDVAEFAFNGHVNHKSDGVSQWRFYAGAVNPNDPRHEQFRSARNNRWGEWRFEEVINDFKPHVVASICDPWMYAYIAKSPFRKYFKLILMPTVDSMPYQNLWISHLKLADAVLTYSNWGYQELDLLDEGIKLVDVASCGVDTNIFMPYSGKGQHKINLGLPDKSIIIGNVARNQPRKLFSDLLQTFKNILQITGRDDVYLLLHTKIPDSGWNIPFLSKNYNIADKVILCYRCTGCEGIELAIYKGDNKPCKHCGGNANLNSTVTAEKLNEIYNTMDVYVQYASAGGFEIPIIEAAACGIQTFAVDVAAMKDFSETIGTIPLTPFKLQIDPIVHSERAVTDNSLNAEIISQYISGKIDIEPDVRISNKVEMKYVWNRVVNKWVNTITSLDINLNSWNKPINLLNPKTELITSDMSRFEMYHIIHDYLGIRDPIVILDLLTGKKSSIIRNTKNVVNLINTCERLRTGQEQLKPADYIEYAKMKAEIYE